MEQLPLFAMPTIRWHRHLPTLHLRNYTRCWRLEVRIETEGGKQRWLSERGFRTYSAARREARRLESIGYRTRLKECPDRLAAWFDRARYVKSREAARSAKEQRQRRYLEGLIVKKRKGLLGEAPKSARPTN